MLAVAIKDLHKTFGLKRALDGASLVVEQGEVFGFIGPNGAGKSTTIRCLMDFIRPTAGSIQLLGKDAQRDSVSLKAEIGYLSADTNLYPTWTGREHIDFVAQVRGVSRDRARQLMKRLEFDPKPRVHQLSSGNQQKLGLILAMMSSPKLLVLDEPTRGLDPLLQVTFQQLMREYCDQGGTVFMSSHNLPEVEQICTDIAVIRDGKTVANETVESLKAKSAHTVKATLAAKPTLPTLTKAGAEDITVVGTTAIFTVRGDLNPILQVLAKTGVHDLEISHASLEELFRELYK